MSKVRNIIFVAIIAVCLFSVIGYKVAVAATPLTAPQRSTLEGREYQGFPKVSTEAISDGDFQDDFEQYIADLIPRRDTVLLANAALQRKTIELANVPFGYAAYPTFFGSKYVYIPEGQLVYEKPELVSKTAEESLDEKAQKYSRIIDNNADVNWVFYLVDRGATSAANPAHALSANVEDYDYLRTEFLDKLPESCVVVDGAYYDSSEFQNDYFHTDHHWRIQGGMKAYEKISEALGNDSIEFGTVGEVYSGPFWGANARSGLAPVGSGDAVFDVEYDKSEIGVKINGKKHDADSLDAGYSDGFEGYEKEETFTNVYSHYFHGDYGMIEIENTQNKNGKLLLVVADSFSNCIERFFAEGYQYVCVLDPRHFNDSIQSVLDEHDFTDGVFFLSEPNL